MLSPPIFPQDLDLMLSQLGEDLKELKGKRIFLTGATGFFGKWLTQTLIKAAESFQLDLHLTLLTRNRNESLKNCPWIESYRTGGVQWVEGDILRLPNLTGKFDVIIHGAAAASRQLNEQSPQIMFDTIVEGTRNVLKLAEKSQCPKLMFISSGAVYGAQPSEVSHLAETFRGGPDPLH